MNYIISKRGAKYLGRLTWESLMHSLKSESWHWQIRLAADRRNIKGSIIQKACFLWGITEIFDVKADTFKLWISTFRDTQSQLK